MATAAGAAGAAGTTTGAAGTTTGVSGVPTLAFPVFLATNAPKPNPAKPATVGVSRDDDPEDATKVLQAASSTANESPGLRETLQPFEKATVAVPLPVAKT